MRKFYLPLLIVVCLFGCVRSPTSSSIDSTPNGDVVTISVEGTTKSVQFLTDIPLSRWHPPSNYKRGQEWHIGGPWDNRIELFLYTPVGGWDRAEFEKELPLSGTISFNDYSGSSNDVIASYTRISGCKLVRSLVFNFSEQYPLMVTWSKGLVKEGYSCTKKFNQWEFKKSYTDDQLKILKEFNETVDKSVIFNSK